MRTTLAYSSARILLLVVSLILLYLVGARGLLLLALACVVSGIASFVLLSRQRDVMSGALMARIRTGQRRAGRVPGQARGRRPRRGRRLGAGYSRRMVGPSRMVGTGVSGPGVPFGSSAAPASHPPVTRSLSTAPTASSRVMAEVSRTRSASRGSS